ncbi:hypothetical protein B2M27_24725 [Kluyvera intermedia]|uniref:Enterobactin exporter EntS n=1 Tax=Kluyvera intermedia TaxID=61648 RepID=A0ABX3U832_KLUIN|nr:hypothetical protein B2M27_24725 [Kluyvera intermedia]
MAAQAPDPGYVLGGLGAVMTLATSASSSGFVLALVGVALVLMLSELRRFRQTPVVSPDGGASA